MTFDSAQRGAARLFRIFTALFIIAAAAASATFPALAATPSALENPQPNSAQSGIGLFSGWACSGPDIGVAIDGGAPLKIPYGGSRADTASVCGASNTATGFGLLFNFNLLGAGKHSAQLLVNGQAASAPVPFTVSVLNGEFVTGLSKQVAVTEFPATGKTTVLGWQQSLQNFVIQFIGAGEEPAKSVARTDVDDATAATTFSLENPGPGSFQSGIGLFSGWSCTGPNVGVSIDGGAPLVIPYGGGRADTASLCGAQNTATGFGLLFNFNVLTAGTHSAQLLVNGQAQGAPTSFTVNKPGGEFLSGASRQVSVPEFPSTGRTTTLVWQESQQNFAIQSVTAPLPLSEAKGRWNGTTSAGETVRIVVQADGTFYIVYTQPGNATEAGVIQGLATTTNGVFASSNAADYAIAQQSETADVSAKIAVSGTYRTGNDLHLTLAGVKGTRTLDATYVAGSESAPSTSVLAGNYTGTSGHVGGKVPASFAIDSAGNWTGRNAACTFGGTAVALPTLNAFQWTVSAISGGCIFGTGTVNGILYYDAPTGVVHGLAPFQDRNDLYYLIGTRSF